MMLLSLLSFSILVNDLIQHAEGFNLLPRPDQSRLDESNPERLRPINVNIKGDGYFVLNNVGDSQLPVNPQKRGSSSNCILFEVEQHSHYVEDLYGMDKLQRDKRILKKLKQIIKESSNSASEKRSRDGVLNQPRNCIGHGASHRRDSKHIVENENGGDITINEEDNAGMFSQDPGFGGRHARHAHDGNDETPPRDNQNLQYIQDNLTPDLMEQIPRGREPEDVYADGHFQNRLDAGGSQNSHRENGMANEPEGLRRYQ